MFFGNMLFAQESSPYPARSYVYYSGCMLHHCPHIVHVCENGCEGGSGRWMEVEG